jgi:glycosyltransferase involved in cell wall biosynthesis
MADAIESLLRDPDRRRDMGEAARRSVIERFTTQRLTENLASVVHQVLNRR